MRRRTGGPKRPRPASTLAAAPQGIPCVLHQDIAWQLLLLERGFGSGQTRWRYLDRRQRAGVFERSHRILFAELNAAGELDRTRACMEGTHVRAERGEPQPARRRLTGCRRARAPN